MAIKLQTTPCCTLMPLSVSFYMPSCRRLQKKVSHILPLLQVRQHDFTIVGDILSTEDHHLTCGSDVADGSSLGVAFLDPQAYWDVVGFILYKSRGERYFVSHILRDYELYLFYFGFELIRIHVKVSFQLYLSYKMQSHCYL